MTERDAAIIELTKSGLSAKKIKERLGLPCSVRHIQRVAAAHVPVGSNTNSKHHLLNPDMRQYVEACLEMRGLDPHQCGLCGDRQTKKCDIHHTKYGGATIYDLMYVCRSCNCARANVGLA